MATTMKGLLKGLRYITQIFDEEKEPEMKIGLPTDVKHVAHIGCDGPSNNTPSWMNEFKAPELESASVASNGDTKNHPTKHTFDDRSERSGVGLQELLPPTQNDKQKHKSRRKTTNGGSSPPASPTKKCLPDVPKPSRRHHSAQNPTESSNQDSSLRRSARKHHHSLSSGGESDSSHRSSRHRKTKSKGSYGGESGSKHSKSNDESSSLRGTCPFTDFRSSNDDGSAKGIE